MSRLILILPALTLLFAAGCGGPEVKNDSAMTGDAPLEAGEHTAVMVVHGMSCPKCANNIDIQLLRVPGVEHVALDLGTGLVHVQMNPEQPPTRESLERAIRETGFTLVSLMMP